MAITQLTAEQKDWLNRADLAADRAQLGTLVESIITLLNDLETRVVDLETP